jgi:D-3-phosphoglycerate dehydrogenase
MKVVNLEPRDFSRAAGDAIGRFARYVPLDPAATYGSPAFRDALAEADVIWTRLAFRVDADLLAMAPRARWVVTPTTGLTHVDEAAVEQAGATLLSLVGETAFLDSITATAELTWLLVLALERHLLGAVLDVRAGRWDRDRWRGRQLAGRRLGIVGMGRLGRMVALYADAFKMSVVHYDPNEPDPTNGSTPVGLDELLESADVVSLHVNLHAGTVGLIGATELATLRPEATLVNTSRGEVVDENALLESLESGRLAGAALDVIAAETDVTSGDLQAHPLVEYARQNHRLLITPHIGGACTDAMQATEVFMVRKLERHLQEEARA